MTISPCILIQSFPRTKQIYVFSNQDINENTKYLNLYIFCFRYCYLL